MVDSAQCGETLARGCGALGVELSLEQRAVLEQYYERVVTWQPRVRLVGDLDPRRFAVRHLLDSLLLVQAVPDLDRIQSLIDIGSGAGLPGLPLAVVCPSLQVQLVESDGRKAAFLKDAVARLGLDNISVRRVRAEGRPDEEGIALAQLVVSRAFTAPEDWLPLAARYLGENGRVVTMMARLEDPDLLAQRGRERALLLEGTWTGTLPDGAGPRVVAVFRPDVPRGTPAR